MTTHSPLTPECRCLICSPGPRDDLDRDTIAIVERYGHQCSIIGPTTPAEPPPYAFTSGMWHSYRQPELAIYGLHDPDIMTRVLNEIASRATQSGRPLEPGDRFAGVLSVRGVAEDEYLVKLVEIHPSWYDSQFGISLAFNADNPVDFLQVLWPDTEGHYPGEPGFNDQISDCQPMLWMPVAEHPPSVWTGPHTRAIIPAARFAALAATVQAWESRSPGPAADAAALYRLAVTLGSTLSWAYSRERGSFTVLPADVQYVAAKAFVAWSDNQQAGDTDDAALGEQLHHACRLLMELGGPNI